MFNGTDNNKARKESRKVSGRRHQRETKRLHEKFANSNDIDLIKSDEILKKKNNEFKNKQSPTNEFSPNLKKKRKLSDVKENNQKNNKKNGKKIN